MNVREFCSNIRRDIVYVCSQRGIMHRSLVKLSRLLLHNDSNFINTQISMEVANFNISVRVGYDSQDFILCNLQAVKLSF